MSQTAAAFAPSVPVGLGAIGTPRDPMKAILLAIVTFGIYNMYWTYKTYDEIKTRRGEGWTGLVGVLLSIAAPWVLAGEVEKLYQDDHKTSPVNSGTGWLVFVPAIGGIMWFMKVQGALNVYWESHKALAV
jgi:hypothetical protein